MRQSKNKGTTVTAMVILNTTNFNKKTLANELGISRPTLDKRLSGESKWKVLEVKWLNVLLNKKDSY